MKSNRINHQTQKNQERRKEYRRRMALWVMTNGVTHRAIERWYFGSETLKYPENQTYKLPRY